MILGSGVYDFRIMVFAEEELKLGHGVLFGNKGFGFRV